MSLRFLTNKSLAYRELQIHFLFSFCKQFDESLMHILFLCPFSRAVGMHIPGGASILDGTHNNITAMFESWMPQSQHQSNQSIWLNTTMIVAWTIWNERCEVVFQDKKDDPLVTVNKALSFSNYIDKLNSSVSLTHSLGLPTGSVIPKWKPPASPFLAFNCDAYYDANTGLTCIAIIVRDFAGRCWGCKSKCYAGVESSEHAKSLAFLDAVIWGVELRYTHIVFETS
ncbi:uncharacterized protein LOC113359997 [Papaver somniferum]|uniref:uncharacterized protein LOC113359997 n=1 Tax=Papaver somniferum TaxID=3469 RepID=UPI000E6F7265|nr:uncharacterized protein LOC113359997 [Papaver somniferum]